MCDAFPPLAGLRVGITADRRAEEQTELLRRHGAQVSLGPVMRTLPLGDDRPLREATERLLADPPTVMLVTTGIGLRSWLGATEAWGTADDLLRVLADVRIHTRGPKAHGAVVQAGLAVARREPSERLDAMVDDLLAGALHGEHVAIQLYGNDVPWAAEALRAAGARVTEVPIYRWVRPDDDGPAKRLIREAIDGHLDAVTFTCPAAVRNICALADEDGLLRELQQAFERDVVAAVVGPVTAEAATDLGIRVGCSPAIGRLGLMVRELTTTLSEHHLHLRSPAGSVLLKGSLVATPDWRGDLADRERDVLAVLARRAGTVVGRAILEREVWRASGERGALDAVLSRLRRSLSPTGLTITTRVRRGYQLDGHLERCPVAVVPESNPA